MRDLGVDVTVVDAEKRRGRKLEVLLGDGSCSDIIQNIVLHLHVTGAVLANKRLTIIEQAQVETAVSTTCLDKFKLVRDLVHAY